MRKFEITLNQAYKFHILIYFRNTPLRFCFKTEPRRHGLVVRVSASHAVGRGSAPRPGHTKDHHNTVQNRSSIVHTDCLKGRVVCRTSYGDMHLKDLMGSIVRVE